jgi:hypothetical protein
LNTENFMRKSLLTLSLALMLGGAAVAVAATQGETAPQTAMPMLLAQASPQPFQQLPPARQLPRGAPLTDADRATRRQAACEDRADRVAGQLAYLEARLDLTAAQRTSFERWRDIRQAAAQRQARTCASRTPLAGRGTANDTRPSPVERMAREEERLRSRLADLTAERPALEALYNSLTPEQRQKFTPAGGALGMGGRGMGRGAPRMAMAMRGARGGMMRGPGGPGRGMGSGMAPGMMPPPGAPGAPPPVQ